VIFGLDHFWFIVYLKAIAWIFQFIGHGVFEKRKPALLNNILTTLVAPDFVTIELMYYIFGYNKELIKQANVEIEADIKAYKGASKGDSYKGKSPKSTPSKSSMNGKQKKK